MKTKLLVPLVLLASLPSFVVMPAQAREHWNAWGAGPFGGYAVSGHVHHHRDYDWDDLPFAPFQAVYGPVAPTFGGYIGTPLRLHSAPAYYGYFGNYWY